MSVINRMSKKQALTALVKVAKLQEKLLKKLAKVGDDHQCERCGNDFHQSELDDWDQPEDRDGMLCQECNRRIRREWWNLEKSTR